MGQRAGGARRELCEEHREGEQQPERIVRSASILQWGQLSCFYGGQRPFVLPAGVPGGQQFPGGGWVLGMGIEAGLDGELRHTGNRKYHKGKWNGHTGYQLSLYRNAYLPGGGGADAESLCGGDTGRCADNMGDVFRTVIFRQGDRYRAGRNR